MYRDLPNMLQHPTPPYRSIGAIWALILLVASAGAGCDADPNMVTASVPPTVTQFSFTPNEVNLTEEPWVGTIENDQVRIPIQIEVQTDRILATGDILYTTIRNPKDNVLLVENVLVPVSGTTYALETDVTIPTGITRQFSIEVTAISASGVEGNRASGQLRVNGAGRPPSIDSVRVDNPIKIPAAGSTLRFTVEAFVSDPDGPNTVDLVTLSNAGGSIFQLCDDGSDGLCGGAPSSGDRVAEDGWFTVTFEIDSTTIPGDYPFNVQATDKTGLEAPVYPLTLSFAR